jgi:hypothetical protein
MTTVLAGGFHWTLANDLETIPTRLGVVSYRLIVIRTLSRTTMIVKGQVNAFCERRKEQTDLKTRRKLVWGQFKIFSLAELVSPTLFNENLLGIL